jgi:hypothetical protein
MPVGARETHERRTQLGQCNEVDSICKPAYLAGKAVSFVDSGMKCTERQPSTGLGQLARGDVGSRTITNPRASSSS